MEPKSTLENKDLHDLNILIHKCICEYSYTQVLCQSWMGQAILVVADVLMSLIGRNLCVNMVQRFHPYYRSSVYIPGNDWFSIKET